MDYALLEQQLRELISGERSHLANAANFAAFVYQEIPNVSWVGFYYAEKTGELVLGPFQGRPACTRLPSGRGVCGTAFTRGETIVVDDVNAFPDHIVCDVAARSEIVVPLGVSAPYGVFDVDSAEVGRFSAQDRDGVENLVRLFIHSVAPPPWQA